MVNIAALIGDHARANMLLALMGGKALTATELASEAHITKQTASSHLSKLLDARLLAVEVQGRHKYFRLAAPDIATLLENLMGVAQRTGTRSIRTGPRDPEMRKARVCYDHLAGDLGVAVYDAMVRQRLIQVDISTEQSTLNLTNKGREFFTGLGIDTGFGGKSRRPVCKACLDWSERRHHMAGQLGKSLLDYVYASKWAKRIEGTRVVKFSATGEDKLRQLFSIASAG